MLRAVQGRALHTTRQAAKSLPLSSLMKSDKLWGNDAPKSRSLDLFRLAQLIEEKAPPLEIAPKFLKKFLVGQAIDPFDFSMHRVNMDNKQAQLRRQKKEDPFDTLGLDPLTLYTMPEVLSMFLLSTGQILPRAVTGCLAANQKKLSNTIKTARACGLLSLTHRHISELPLRNI